MKSKQHTLPFAALVVMIAAAAPGWAQDSAARKNCVV
jgi:hypothetical protein